MTDLLIIGKGPAGWSCAMTARMRGLSVLVAAPEGEHSVLAAAKRIDNYPGLPGLSGKEMLTAFREQAMQLGAEETGGLVRMIARGGNNFSVLCENDVLEARAVVIASGAARSSPLPGEDALLGRGVSYCATCDGMFYRGKEIAVLSWDGTGLRDTEFLAGLAAKLDFYPVGRTEEVPEGEKITLRSEKPLSLGAENGKIRLSFAEGSREYDGAFLFRPAIPVNMLMPDLETDGPFLKVNRRMETNIPGIFAAGDCTGAPFQAAKAAGEGNIAALSCADFLHG